MTHISITHLLLFSIPLVLVDSQNIENYFSTNHSIIFKHPHHENIYFGFSVQLQTSSGSSRLIVGSPRSNEINRKLSESGAIFSCSLDRGTCETINLNTGTDLERNHSLLGFSVDIDQSSRLLACAPKLLNYEVSNPDSIFRHKLNGMCYYLPNANDNSKYKELKPLQSNDLQILLDATYHYIFGESGFSSRLIEGSNHLVLSGIGLYNWTGGVIQYDTSKSFGADNFVAYPRNVLQTYSYFGYSFEYGRFNSSDPNKVFYVSGAPRDNNLTGKVLLFEKLTGHTNMNIKYIFLGKQFGEYFGASLAVADLNGDKIDDVVIGAPMHSADGKYERGKIYGYITKNNIQSRGSIDVEKKIKIEFIGEESGDKFGTAITNLGDINNDGCEDIAVGAPYYKNKGVVYIYLGSQNNGLLLSQKIYAAEFEPHLQGFGYSLSRGLDIDNNFNNDLAIGSYLSGHVVVLKTRPTINLESTLTADIHQIDIKTRNFQLNYCLIYYNNKVPNVHATVELKSYNTHVRFKSNNDNTYKQEDTLEENKKICRTLALNVDDNLTNKVKIIMNVNTFNKYNEHFCKFCPFIAKKEELYKELNLPFIFNCKGEICKPDLKLSAYLPSESGITIGAQTELDINISIENLGENAFGIKLIIEIFPKYLHGNIDGMSICTNNGTTIECNFNRYLETHEKIYKIFTLNLNNLKLSDTNVRVKFSVSSNGEDTDESNNIQLISIPVSLDVLYNIIPKSEPEQIEIPKYENIKFDHIYIIESKGKTEVQYLDAYFLVPYQYNNKIIVNEISGCNFQEEIEIPAKIEKGDETEIENVNLNCSSTHVENLKCKKLKCRLTNDDEDDDKMIISTVKLSFYVNGTQISDESKTFYLVTSMEIKSEYVNMIEFTKSNLISTNVKSANITLYICLGILCAIIVLAIIVAVCYKFGNFKKFKPPEETEEGKELLDETNNSTNDLKQENLENVEEIIVKNDNYEEVKIENNEK